jgi:hypothetical protein
MVFIYILNRKIETVYLESKKWTQTNLNSLRAAVDNFTVTIFFSVDGCYV